MNYLKQNHLSILIILFLVVSAILPNLAPATFGALNSTTIGNPWIFQQDVTLSGSSTDLAIGGTITVNGVTNTVGRETLRTSTTTVCALQSPSGTTTLQSFVATFTVGSTTNKSVVFTTGAAMQSTTTALSGLLALASGAQGTFQASTTNAEATRVIAPSAWVQVSMIGGAGVDSPSGTCSAVFRSI